MSLSYLRDPGISFEYQYRTVQNFIIPFLAKHLSIENGIQVLDVGCGEGGLLKAFSEKDCFSIGLDLNQDRINEGKRLLEKEIMNCRVRFICKNIYDANFKEQFKSAFDLIILKDAIEHIPDQDGLINYLKILLKKKGKIFFGFPPWQMPFGGHQHICRNKLLSHLPYYHLIPIGLYKSILNFFREPADVIEALVETKILGISIERFERILEQTGFHTVARRLYLLSPTYKYKFNLNPVEQFKYVGAIPYFRNFLTTAAYYIVEHKTRKGRTQNEKR